MARRINKKLYLALIAVALIVITVLAIVLAPKTCAVDYKIVKNGIQLEGVIIRTEQAVDLSEYEKLDFGGLIDGQKVEAGQQVVSAYKKGYIKTTIEKLVQTEENIVTYLNQTILTNYDDKEIERFDFEIDVVIRKMAELDQGYIELYRNLCDLIEQRREYINEKYMSEKNTYLEDLYKDEQNLQEAINAWLNTFCADEDGYISFYCDGLEENLLPQEIDSLTLTQSTLDKIKKAANPGNSYKIVTDEKWYIAIPYSKDVSMLQQEMYYSVYIGNENESELGCLSKIISNKRDNVLVFEFDKNVQKYLDKRVVNILIGERYEGFSIKNEFVNDSQVIIKTNDGKQRVDVEILFSDDKNTIIKETPELKLRQKVYLK